jgi:hypothetical protein
LVLDLQQPVHSAIAAVVVDLGQARDDDLITDPAGAGQLGEGLESAVADHGEEGAFGAVVEASPAEQAVEDLVESELAPELVEQPGATQGTRVEELELGSLKGDGLARIESAGEGGDEATDSVLVELVGATEAVEDLGLGLARGGMPFVVSELEVADHGAVAVVALDGPKVHAQMIGGVEFRIKPVVCLGDLAR